MPCNACLVFLYERCLSHILTHYNVCEWMELSWIHIFSITTWKWWWVVEKTYSMFKWCSIEISLMVNKHVLGLVEGHMPSWPHPIPCMALTWTNVWVIYTLPAIVVLCCIATLFQSKGFFQHRTAMQPPDHNVCKCYNYDKIYWHHIDYAMNKLNVFVNS